MHKVSVSIGKSRLRCSVQCVESAGTWYWKQPEKTALPSSCKWERATILQRKRVLLPSIMTSNPIAAISIMCKIFCADFTSVETLWSYTIEKKPQFFTAQINCAGVSPLCDLQNCHSKSCKTMTSNLMKEMMSSNLFQTGSVVHLTTVS